MIRQGLRLAMDIPGPAFDVGDSVWIRSGALWTPGVILAVHRRNYAISTADDRLGYRYPADLVPRDPDENGRDQPSA